MHPHNPMPPPDAEPRPHDSERVVPPPPVPPELEPSIEPDSEEPEAPEP